MNTYIDYQNPRKKLAYAANDTDPFGLSTTQIAAPTASAPTAPAQAPPVSYGNTTPVSAPQTPTAPASSGAQPATAPTVGGYDVNTDPIYAQIVSMLGRSDSDANTAALAQQKQTLLGYGSGDLAQQMLGDADLAKAAADNPTSTLSQLGQQRDRNTHQLTEDLNKNNLLYSGYRVNQEQQAGQDYNNALARAAAAVNDALAQIAGNKSAALNANALSRLNAMTDSYGRAPTGGATQPGGTPPPGPTPPGPTPPGGAPPPAAPPGGAPPPAAIGGGLAGNPYVANAPNNFVTTGGANAANDPLSVYLYNKLMAGRDPVAGL